MLVSALVREIAQQLSDPHMKENEESDYFDVINAAARDARNKGVLLHQADAESIVLASNTFKYANIPPAMAYVHQIRISNADFSVTDTTAQGATLASTVSTTTETSFDVSSLSGLVVNMVTIIGTEAVAITALDPDSTPLSITVLRGQLGTTAATHSSGAALLISNVTQEFNSLLPPVYYGNTFHLTGEGARLELDSRIFFIDAGKILSFTGQKRPTIYVQDSETVDPGLESFLRERAKFYAGNMMASGGSQLSSHRTRVAEQAYAVSQEFMTVHPKEFRQRPRSIYVPGR